MTSYQCLLHLQHTACLSLAWRLLPIPCLSHNHRCLLETTYACFVRLGWPQKTVLFATLKSCHLISARIHPQTDHCGCNNTEQMESFFLASLCFLQNCPTFLFPAPIHFPPLSSKKNKPFPPEGGHNLQEEYAAKQTLYSRLMQLTSEFILSGTCSPSSQNVKLL